MSPVCAQAQLRLGSEVVGLQQAAGGGVTVLVRAGDSAEPHHLSASAVLGCDGAASTVRGLLDIGLEGLRFEERWLVVDLRSEQRLNAWDGVHQVCDPQRAATYMRVTDDRLRFEFRLAPAEEASALARPESLGRLLSPWTGSADLTGFEVVRSVEYTFRARLAQRWRAGRVFLLGDAAHETPPFIGQGIGLGLRDAENLAWKLAAVRAGASEAMLDTYQAERKPQAKALIRKAITAGWAMTGGQDQAARARQLVLALVCRIPRFGPAVLDRPSPPLRPGPLVARRRFPGALPGRLIPQPLLADGTGFDALLGGGFAVVSGSRPPPDLVAAARSLGAVQLRLDALRGPSTRGAVDVIREWLRRGHSSAVLVRPDRVVLAAADRRGRVPAATLDAALATLGRGLTDP